MKWLENFIRENILKILRRANWTREISSRLVAFSAYIGKVSQILSFHFQVKGEKFYHYFPGNSNLRQAPPPRWIGQTCRLWRNQGRHQVHQLQIRLQHDVNRLFSEPSEYIFDLNILFSCLRTLRINNLCTDIKRSSFFVFRLNSRCIVVLGVTFLLSHSEVVCSSSWHWMLETVDWSHRFWKINVFKVT